MSINGSVTGRIVAEPEDKALTDKFSVFEFPLYSDRRVKNRDSNEYESDPAGTTKIQVALKFDERDEWKDKLKKGDVVKITGSFFEREFTKKDQTKGRSLQTDFIESVELVYSKPDEEGAASNDGGFTDNTVEASF